MTARRRWRGRYRVCWGSSRHPLPDHVAYPRIVEAPRNGRCLLLFVGVRGCDSRFASLEKTRPRYPNGHDWLFSPNVLVAKIVYSWCSFLPMKIVTFRIWCLILRHWFMLHPLKRLTALRPWKYFESQKERIIDSSPDPFSGGNLLAAFQGGYPPVN